MALTTNRYDERHAAGWQLPFPVAASTTIYKGALVCLNGDGYLVPGADTAGLRFIGVARDGADNSAGDAGDKEVVVVTQGSISVKKEGAKQADVGMRAYIVDDETIFTATSSRVYAGLIVGVLGVDDIRLRFDACGLPG